MFKNPQFNVIFVSQLRDCASFPTFVEMVTLFSCMCMMASDTLTEIESAASSMLNGPSSFSETWYRASNGGQQEVR